MAMEAGMEMQEAGALRLLAVSAFRYYLATLAAAEGNPTPRIAQERDQLRTPQPGDWVMEISTIWDARSDFDRIGRLILVRDEIVPYAEEQEVAGDDSGGVRERFSYIERLDGTLFRWHNCEFLRLFADIRSDDEIDATMPAHDTDMRRSMWVSSAKRRHGVS
jgi:hypothetical protein